MTYGGNNFNNFPENQFTKYRGLNSIKANQNHTFFSTSCRLLLKKVINFVKFHRMLLLYMKS